MTLDEFIETHTYPQPERDGPRLAYRGWRPHDVDTFDVPEGFEPVFEWWDGTHRAIWVSPAHSAILSYTEGDILLETFDDAGAFAAALELADEFYQGLRS